MRHLTLATISLVAASYLLVEIGLAETANIGDRPAGPPIPLKPSDVTLPVDTAALERQYQALSAMPSVKVTYSAQGLIRNIAGHTGVALSSRSRAPRPGDSADEVLERFRAVLLASGEETLKVRLSTEAMARTRVIKMEQYIHGIPVVHGSVAIRVEEATGIVRSFNAFFLPDRDLPRTPKITASEATALAVQVLETRDIAKPGTVKVSDAPTLAYHGLAPDSERGRLVWAVTASYSSAATGDPGDGVYWIDAIDGEHVGSGVYSVAGLLNRTVYTANNTSPDPGTFPAGLTLLFGEDGSSSDPIAMSAYNNAAKVDAMYTSVFAWNNGPLGLIVNYNTGSTPNAHFNRRGGVDYLRFSNGSAAYIPLANSLDVVAHEFGHAVAWNLTGILPGPDPLSDPQSAALDEGFSDISTINVDIYDRPGIVPATWVIAEIFTSDPTKGLRNAADPRSASIFDSDWFPARTKAPQDVSRHKNSTILSHAYKLMVTGGFHVRAGQPIGGLHTGQIPSLFVPALGHDKAAQIILEAFRDPTMDTFPTFNLLKAAAEQAASLYGPVEQDAVDRAFRAVGVGVGCTAPPPPPTLDVIDLCTQWRLTWSPVPGATSYHGQRNPAAWGWANAATIIDDNNDHCIQQVTVLSHARLRACNGCGCSAWSNAVDMWKWSQCP